MKTPVYIKKMAVKGIFLTLISSLFVFTSCSDDEETYDVEGATTNYVSFCFPTLTTGTGTIIHSPVGDFAEIAAKFPVTLQHAASQTVTVSAVADASLVDAYNKEHDTTYTAFPSEAINTADMTATIEQGQLSSSDSISITVNSSALTSLTADSYLLAIRLSGATGGVECSSVNNVKYVTFSTDTRLVKTISSSADMEGTLLGDYSGWTATYGDGSEVSNVAELFDGDQTNGPSMASNKTLVIDMKAEKKVSGFRFLRKVNKYGAYYFTSVMIEYSNDGTNWTTACTGNDSNMVKEDNFQYLSFLGGLGMRYLRLTVSYTGSTKTFGELGVYVK